LTFTLSFNATVMCVFEKIPLTASVVVDTPSIIAAATVEAKEKLGESTFGTTGESITVRYGATVRFSAEAESGYSFNGWYLDGTLVSDSADYDRVMEASVELTAKFNATVTLAVSHTPAADSGGTVQIDEGTAGTTAELEVILGDTCTITAIEAGTAIFEAWFLTSDSGFLAPLVGYGVEHDIVVVATTLLTSRFVGAADIVDRRLAVLNYNNEDQQEDALIGLLQITLGDHGEETSLISWNTFRTDPASPPEDDEVPSEGNRYFKFSGSQSTTLTAIANSELGFMHWTCSYLTPITPTPEQGEEQFTESEPVIVGTSPTITIVTNRHYVMRAVWGAPRPVQVTMAYADVSDATIGSFLMLPAT
jgi:hypothetical protein